MSLAKGGKAEKTNWVIHQYHLGTGEDERDGEYVVSKLFFQQQFKPGDKNAQELTTSDDLESMAAEADLPDFTTLPADKHVGTIQVVHNSEQNLYQVTEYSCVHYLYFLCCAHLWVIGMFNQKIEHILLTCFLIIENTFFLPNVQVNRNCEINIEETVVLPPSEKAEDGDNPQSQDPKLWEGDSQFELLDTQQLAEGLALCDEFLLSQSQTSCGGGDEPKVTKPCLAAYAHLSAEDFKKDLEECQRLEPTDDNTNLELDNTNEFRLSQIVWFRYHQLHDQFSISPRTC